jgi:hypothetical protein
MDRGFYNEDFDLEELIRFKSDQFKMHPSESVWKRIAKKIHPVTPYLWVGLAVVLTGAGYLAATETGILFEDAATLSHKISARTVVASSAKSTLLNRHTTTPELVDANELNDGISLSLKPSLTNGLTLETASSVMKRQEVYDALTVKTNTAAQIPVQPVQEKHSENQTFYPKVSAFARLVRSITPTGRIEPSMPFSFGLKSKEDKGMQGHEKLNWLQEYAAYELSLPKKRRMNWLVTLSPTMNYRRLVGGKTAELPADVKNGPIALSLKGNVDALVNHQPARGLELSSLFAYTLNRKWTFLTGVQFNYSRYDIKAFSAPANEKATISLSRYSGVQELTSYTILRNFGGTSEKTLQNEYYQVSLPVGMQYTLAQAGRWHLGLSGTIQPTYLLNKNNYLISTDYKNYTKEPTLVNPWNINTSAEAFIAYKYGNTRIQVGPQFRYQLFSSFAKEYPVKEYLMQYGFKVGISRTVH